MGTARFEFDSKKAYRLVCVTDREGKTKTSELYTSVEGCVAVNLRYDCEGNTKTRMKIPFVQDETGMWINRCIHTSTIDGIAETESGLNIYTRNSAYQFESAELNEVPVCAETNIIELYLSSEEGFGFAKGFYRDSEGSVKELFPHYHVGMCADSVLLRESESGEYLARYFNRIGMVEFYDTLYQQQPYDLPMLIHNTSRKYPLKIRFERLSREWIIAPGGENRIVPFEPAGFEELKNGSK